MRDLNRFLLVKLSEKMKEGGSAMNGKTPAIDRNCLFSETAVFLKKHAFHQMLNTIQAIEKIIRTSSYRKEIVDRGPRFSPEIMERNTRGVFIGYDFHISDDGPKLIEVNTNAGGSLLLGEYLGDVEPTIEVENQAYEFTDSQQKIESAIVDMMRDEWNVAYPEETLRSVAIVDESPQDQYLYPEMCLIRDLLEREGIRAVITDPRELLVKGDEVFLDTLKIDFIYNRVTDFYFSKKSNQILNRIFRNNLALISPSPRHHALIANKANLEIFSNGSYLDLCKLEEHHREGLRCLPKVRLLDSKNADEMWAQRKDWFFKPRDGYGARAVYRGAKITKKVWETIVESNYVAQEFIKAPTRILEVEGESVELKYDMRVYTYAGEPFALAARLYQGQVTNFRTAGGGFAPIILTD